MIFEVCVGVPWWVCLDRYPRCAEKSVLGFPPWQDIWPCNSLPLFCLFFSLYPLLMFNRKGCAHSISACKRGHRSATESVNTLLSLLFNPLCNLLFVNFFLSIVSERRKEYDRIHQAVCSNPRPSSSSTPYTVALSSQSSSRFSPSERLIELFHWKYPESSQTLTDGMGNILLAYTQGVTGGERPFLPRFFWYRNTVGVGALVAAGGVAGGTALTIGGLGLGVVSRSIGVTLYMTGQEVRWKKIIFLVTFILWIPFSPLSPFLLSLLFPESLGSHAYGRHSHINRRLSPTHGPHSCGIISCFGRLLCVLCVVFMLSVLCVLCVLCVSWVCCVWVECVVCAERVVCKWKFWYHHDQE